MLPEAVPRTTLDRRERPGPYEGRAAAWRVLASRVASASPPVRSRDRVAELRAADLGLVQRVADYRSPAQQARYLHMYAGKSIAAWRAIRAALGWASRKSDEALVSIGAGPGLDALGFCFDRKWRGTLSLVDPIRWSVWEDPAWRGAVRELTGAALREAFGCYLPPGPLPRQLASVPGCTAFSIDEVPDRCTLLLPFVVNHLMEGPDASAVERLAAMLEQRRARGGRIVISDVHADKMPCWTPLTRSLGVREPPVGFTFSDMLRRMAPLYPEVDRDPRTRPRTNRFAVVRVLVGDADGWYWLRVPGGV